MRAKSLALVSIFAALPLAAQNTPLQNVSWLEGCWQLSRGTTTTTVERWLAPSANVMTGESWTITNGAERESERLRLFVRGDTLVYEATPSSQATTQFRTITTTGPEITFANPSHDFPQRIVYRRVGNDSLIARIEGDRAGRRQPVSFSYRRVSCATIVEAPSAVARRVLEPLYADLSAREIAYGGAMSGWLADNAGPGFRHTIWASSTPTVPVASAPVFARSDSMMKANPNRIPITNRKFAVTLDQVLPRGDSLDVLVSIRRSWNFADSAGNFGPPGGNPERESVQRRLDRWLKVDGAWKLREAMVVSDESSVDGRMVLKNGRPIPPRLAGDNAIFQTSGAFFAISSPNADSSRAWYVDKLGMRVIMQPPAQNGTRVIVVSGGGLTVEILENSAAVPLRTAAPAIAHTTLVHGTFKAGLYVDDFEGTLRRLRDRGGAIAMGPFPAANGVPANAIVRDNYGNFIQFFAR